MSIFPTLSPSGTAGAARVPRGLLTLALFSMSVLLPIQAVAWGVRGHQLIAEVAEAQLSEAAGSEARRLLALEPGATLRSVATWADDVRTKATAPWHHVNFSRNAECRYEPERHCVKGQCIVGAIERQVAVLASNAPDAQRLSALKYVVHFVGDVHAPPHAGFADDARGHRVQLQDKGQGTNLHRLWDTNLIRHWPGGDAALKAAVMADKTAVDVSMHPEVWAEEGCRLVSTPGFYPGSSRLDDAYAQRWDPVLAQRLSAASRRLAATLNQALTKP